jgi:Tat protein secretion system quality control protein TatD with DNase activity
MHAQVIRAVPEERLLIESDQHSPTDGEKDLRVICEIIAEVLS